MTVCFFATNDGTLYTEEIEKLTPRKQTDVKDYLSGTAW